MMLFTLLSLKEHSFQVRLVKILNICFMPKITIFYSTVKPMLVWYVMHKSTNDFNREAEGATRWIIYWLMSSCHVPKDSDVL